MVKLALLVPIIMVFGAPAKKHAPPPEPDGVVKVDGVDPVAVGKSKAFPSTCSAPLKVTAAGPGTLVIDVRGKDSDLSKALELDITRNAKNISKNAVTMKKSKTAGKGFAGLGQIVMTVPHGEQQYSIACDATTGVAMSFRLSKKIVKGNDASPEVAIEEPKPAPELAAKPEAKEAPKPEVKPAGGNAYPGLFAPTTTVFAPTTF